MRRICIFILLYLMLLHFIPARAAITVEQKADSIILELDKYCFSQGAMASKLVGELYELANQHSESSSLLAKAVYWDVYLQYAQGRNDSTLMPKIQMALSFYDEEKYPTENTKLLYANALINISQGNYAEVFRNCIEALEKFEKQGDKDFTSKTLSLLGFLSFNTQNLYMAESYFDRALELASSDSREYYMLRTNKFRLYYLKNEPQIAIDSFLYFMPSIEKYQDSLLTAASYATLGLYYMIVEDMQNAYRYYSDALNIVEKIDNIKMEGLLYQYLGSYYAINGNYRKSYEYYMKSEELVIEMKNISQVQNLLYHISLLFSELNNCDSSLYYLKKSVELNELNYSRKHEINEVYNSYFSMLIESSENKYQIAEKDLLLKQKQFWVIFISSGAIILIIVLVLTITIQNQRNTRQKAILKEKENKELSERLLQNQKIKELQDEKLELQVREMASSSLLLSFKNNILQQISDLSDELIHDKSKAEEISFKIKRIIKNNVHTESGWNDFVIHFNKIRPHFFDKLQRQYPTLTQNETKLCAYIRMGMSIKQIAQMLNLMPSSVKISRHRLRQKLNLQTSDNLDEFIQSL